VNVTETQSILPLLVFAIPIAFSIPILTLGRRYGACREWLALAGLAATLAVTVVIYQEVVGGEARALVWHEWFYIDGLSLLMEFVGSVVGIIVVLYSAKYMNQKYPSGSAAGPRLSLYYGLTVLFVGLMNWTCATNSLFMLYVALEISTLATVYLVAFDWQRKSLEAAYKYLILITVGVVFSLLGGVLLLCASGGGETLWLSEMGELAAEVPRTIALLSCGLFIVGFGTKAGLVPFHGWVPDAYAEAPAPISVLLSGVVTKMGAYALARTVFVFAPHYREVVLLAAIMGSISMILGIVMAFAQTDLKRLLAYSSVSEAGFIVAGLGLGTYLGIYGGLFQLVNHTILKGLLFLCSGALLYALGSRSIVQLRTMPKKMLVTGFCFIVAALAIGGMPPFSAFMSELTLFLGLADSDLLWTSVVLIVAGFLTVVVLVWAGYRIFWAKPSPQLAPVSDTGPKEGKEIPPLMWGCMLFLAILTLFLGLYPQAIYPLLDSATNGVMAISAVP
jgi:formate hydrogenlyase subunit 3/multisubunit Na+/H+ antiporter MnhD subunit